MLKLIKVVVIIVVVLLARRQLLKRIWLSQLKSALGYDLACVQLPGGMRVDWNDGKRIQVHSDEAQELVVEGHDKVCTLQAERA